jgi:hypothetical protein
MFKNARRQVIANNDHLRSRYPSYFIECLFYNLPDRFFGYSYHAHTVKLLIILETP